MVPSIIVTPPDVRLLLLHRRFWQPACYVHPRWLVRLGIMLAHDWRYGQCIARDHCLDDALRRRYLKNMVLPSILTNNQIKLIDAIPRLSVLALAMGITVLACSDYVLLPAYRAALKPWLNNEQLWRLFGLFKSKRKASLTATQLPQMARSLGIALLHRWAEQNNVLRVLLLALPPPERALRPTLSLSLVPLLEKIV